MKIETFIDKHIRADVTTHVKAWNGNGKPAKYFGPTADLENALSQKAQALSAPFLDYEAAARADGWEPHTETAGLPNGGKGWVINPIPGNLSRLHALRAASWKDACEQNNTAPHEIPVIGHYIVTSELADKLEARGERVERDFGGNIVWARKDTVSDYDDFDPSLDRDPVLLAIFEAEHGCEI